MIANIMPYHGTHVGGLGGLSIPDIDADSKTLIDQAEDNGTEKNAATILAQIGKNAFKDKQFAEAFAYYSAAAGLGDFPDAEYNAARSLQELSKASKAKGDLATAKEAATNALAWFSAAVTTANLTKSLDTKADAEEQIEFMKSYISDLGKQDADGKKTLTEAEKAAAAAKDKDKDKGMGMGLVLGIGFILYMLSRGK